MAFFLPTSLGGEARACFYPIAPMEPALPDDPPYIGSIVVYDHGAWWGGEVSCVTTSEIDVHLRNAIRQCRIVHNYDDEYTGTVIKGQKHDNVTRDLDLIIFLFQIMDEGISEDLVAAILD